jgi:hypothetical protein
MSRLPKEHRPQSHLGKSAGLIAKPVRPSVQRVQRKRGKSGPIAAALVWQPKMPFGGRAASNATVSYRSRTLDTPASAGFSLCVE